MSVEERLQGRCGQCGATLATGVELCPYHVGEKKYDDWSTENRIWCDYFHRKKPIERLSPLPMKDW